jgi:hypothetical protein
MVDEGVARPAAVEGSLCGEALFFLLELGEKHHVVALGQFANSLLANTWSISVHVPGSSINPESS